MVKKNILNHFLLITCNAQWELNALQKKKNMELQLVADLIYSCLEENSSEYLEAMYQILYCEGWER